MFFKNKSKNPSKISFEAVRAALSVVVDPPLNKDILSAGAVKALKIGEGSVHFTLQLAAMGQQAQGVKQQCEQRLSTVPGVKVVEIQLEPRVPPTSAPKAAPKQGQTPERLSLPGVKFVVAVASGKGGVGKSTVTANLAVALAQSGAKVGLLDADIYGPSVPIMLGARGHRMEGQRDEKVVPLVKAGIKLMSMGFLVPEDSPVVWRGPMVHGALSQFMTQVEWGELDYLLIDMPPGTGDAQLTISQLAPLSGAVIVTTPQDVALADAQKGLKMFENVNVPILGIVENMSGMVCGHCGEVSEIFKRGGGRKIAESCEVPFLGAIPIDPQVVVGGDDGDPVVHSAPDSIATRVFLEVADALKTQLEVMVQPGKQAFKPIALDWQS